MYYKHYQFYWFFRTFINQFIVDNKMESDYDERDYYTPGRKRHRRQKRFKGDIRPPSWPGPLWYTSTRINYAATYTVWRNEISWSKYSAWGTIHHFFGYRTIVVTWWRSTYRWTRYYYPYTAYYYDENFISYFTELLKKSYLNNIFDKNHREPSDKTVREYKSTATIWANYLLNYSPTNLAKGFQYKHVSTNIMLCSMSEY